MRISDWSSDVCSSDLAIHARRDMRHFAHGTVDEAVLARLLEAAHAAPSVGLMQPWRFVRVTEGALRGAIYEIGRASCRERGCQYVLFPVVAVSLKNKNKNIQ